MNTTDLLARWSAMSLDEIDAELETGASDDALNQLLGPDEVTEMREVLASATRGPARREAVIMLPGLMGSLLSSIRGKATLLWINPLIVVKGQTHLLELNADGTGDGAPIVFSVPSGVEKVCYLKLLLALHRECLLFEFPYDWRRRIESNADLLAQAIERWADGDPRMQFTLVGHSMGGLVARTYLARHREAAKRRVKRVIMHGTPHFGAAGAVADVMLGNSMAATASHVNANNNVRRMILSMPSAYQLLPAPPDLFPKNRPYPADFDVYDPSFWRVEGFRPDYLAEGRRFHELLADFDHPVEMFQIAGCHLETTVDVKMTFDGQRPRLEVVRKKDGSDSGDGTVPLWSARLPGAQIYYIQHVHRYLSRNKDVVEATLALIRGDTPKLPSELPQPKSGLLDLFRGPTGSPATLADRLRHSVESGTVTDQDLQLLYFMG